MADLIVNAQRKFQEVVRRSSFEVAANLEVFAGQFMEAATGGIINANGAGAGADAVGFALGYVDNRTGSTIGGAARAAQVEVAVEGYVWLSVNNGAAFTYDDVGLQVFNDTDGNTFNTTKTTNTGFGVIVNVDAAVAGGANTEEVLVYFNCADFKLKVSDYELAEEDTGRLHVDGYPIYRKIIAMAAGPNASTVTFAHGITGLRILLPESGGELHNAGFTDQRLVPSGANITDTTAIGFFANATNLSLTSGATGDYSSHSGHFVMYYTRTAG